MPTKKAVTPRKKASVPQSSAAEGDLASLLTAAGLEDYTTQYKYVPGRKFSADFAFVEQKLIVEVDGGIYSRRAHGSITGIIADMNRSNLAACNGFRVMRFRPDQIKKQPTMVIDLIKAALNYTN